MPGKRPHPPRPAPVPDLEKIRERCATAMGALQNRTAPEPRAALWSEVIADVRALCLEVERLRERETRLGGSVLCQDVGRLREGAGTGAGRPE